MCEAEPLLQLVVNVHVVVHVPDQREVPRLDIVLVGGPDQGVQVGREVGVRPLVVQRGLGHRVTPGRVDGRPGQPGHQVAAYRRQLVKEGRNDRCG